MKRLSKIEGEQTQPEENGLGDGDIEPPVAKKTKKVKEKANGLAGESDASEHRVNFSSAVSSGVAPQSASGDADTGEQDSAAEVLTPSPRSPWLG